jgi:hypothetical protein
MLDNSKVMLLCSLATILDIRRRLVSNKKLSFFAD